MFGQPKMGSREILGQRNFEYKRFWVKNLAKKNVKVKIRSVTAWILLILTNFTWTNVAWTNDREGLSITSASCPRC